VFVDAEIKIDGPAILVHSNAVKNRVAMRFAFSNTAEPNLFNMEGLPAAYFRTDD
jgi:sialate O-acetylesterase